MINNKMNGVQLEKFSATDGKLTLEEAWKLKKINYLKS